MELMNIKFHTIIADIMGKTGTAVVEAIIAGERNAANFLPLIGAGIKADAATIEKSLQGNWSDEHLFTLTQNYEMYKAYGILITQCDWEIEKAIQKYVAIRNEGVIETPATVVVPESATVLMENKPCKEVATEEQAGADKAVEADKEKNDKKKAVTVVKKITDKNSPRIDDVRGYLKEIFRVDIMAIPGINSSSALTILSEIGTDMTKWKNEKHFASWLNLCPNNKISGGKLISSHIPNKKPNAACLAFRAAANGVQRSDNHLGHYYRKQRGKNGGKHAVIATGNKIATILFLMVTKQEEYKPVDMVEYESKNKKARIARLEKELNKLKAA